MAFQRNPHDLVLFIQEFLLLETNQHFVLYGKNKTILGYHWLSQSLYSDLVVVDSNGIEFYKLFPKLGKILTVRAYQLSVGHYWFESTEGVLVAASSPPRLGQFNTFFINQNKGAKFFNGQRFVCDLAPSVTDKWTDSSPNIGNLIDKQEIGAGSTPHIVSLIYLYGYTYFFHAQCLTGKINYYKLTHEKVSKVDETIIVPVGQYGIRLIDNLLVIQNYSLQESYLIDIKSKKYSTRSFYTFWNSMRNSPPELTIKVKTFVRGYDVEINSEVLYNGKGIGRTDQYVTINALKGAGEESAVQLNSSLVYVDKDICVDTKEGRCYKLTIHSDLVVSDHPDRIESILFLLRRSNCKNFALQYLKKCIKGKIDIKLLSDFFDIISLHYKAAALEKKNRNSSQVKKQDLQPRKNSYSSESDLKVDQGSTILLQSDIFSILFQPLFEEGIVGLDYLSLCIQEYLRSLINQDIYIQQTLQVLFVRVLLKSNQFIKVQQLLQYHIVSDSLELVKALLEVSRVHHSAFVIAIDMMYRLKAYDSLIDFLIDSDFFYEALKTMEYKNPSKLDILKFIAKSQQTGDQQTVLMANKIVQEWTFLNKT